MRHVQQLAITLGYNSLWIRALDEYDLCAGWSGRQYQNPTQATMDRIGHLTKTRNYDVTIDINYTMGERVFITRRQPDYIGRCPRHGFYNRAERPDGRCDTCAVIEDLVELRR